MQLVFFETLSPGLPPKGNVEMSIQFEDGSKQSVEQLQSCSDAVKVDPQGPTVFQRTVEGENEQCSCARAQLWTSCKENNNLLAVHVLLQKT